MPSQKSLRWLFVRLPLDPETTEPQRPKLFVAVLLVMVGGVAGSILRSAIAQAIPHHTAQWPWSTMIVNIAGSGALAVVLIVLIERPGASTSVRPLVCTGFIGGFTTYSTFALDFVDLSRGGRSGVAFGYVAVTLALTFAAAIGGIYLGKVVSRLVYRPHFVRRVQRVIDNEVPQ